MKNVRMGIAGVGNMGSVHAQSIAVGNVEGMTFAAVCDTDETRRMWAVEQFPDVRAYADYEEMIASGEIDAVLVATPHYLHPDIAVCGFEHGLHVLVEKPAGVYTKQVERMNAAAKQSGKVFGIMYNQRTNPTYRLVREMVRSGKLGALKRFVWIITNWYRTQAYYDSGTWRATWGGEGGGLLINQCPHNLDLWQWIFGMPARVRGFCTYGKYHNIEVEDDVTAYAEYDNGATAVFISSTGECPGTNRLEISGDRGKLVVEGSEVKFWELAQPEREYCFATTEGFVPVASEFRVLMPEGTETAHNGILQNFADAVLHGVELIAPGEEGSNGLSISNAIYLSDWMGETVALPVDGDRFERMLRERIRGSKGKGKRETAAVDLRGSYEIRW